MTDMDMIKSLELFDADKYHYNNAPIAVIGAGATGSALALQLAMLGLKLAIYDFDKIEAHNIANQLLYSHDDIGLYKADILAFKINQKVGAEVCYSKVKKVDSDCWIRNKTVFFCVDTMAARKEMFLNVFKINGFTENLVDIRINALSGQINIFDPSLLDHANFYETTLYDDSEVNHTLGSCGITLSMGATASIASSLATWMFIDRMTGHDKYTFQRNFNLRPFFTVDRKFP